MKDSRELIVSMFLIAFAISVIIVIVIGGTFLNLWTLPFVMNQQTEIIHNSNGYVTSHQEMLREWLTSYYSADATAGQKNALIAQMREAADQIPGFVPPDIEQFLSSHN